MTPLDFDPDDTASRVRVLPLPTRLAAPPLDATARHTKRDGYGFRVCGVLGCSARHFGYGRCNKHYKRFVRRAS